MYRACLVDVGVNVVIGIWIAPMPKLLGKSVGNNFQTAVVSICVMNCDPHRCSAERIGQLKVGVVGMPVCSHAAVSGFVEHLIENLDDGRAEQCLDRGDDFR